MAASSDPDREQTVAEFVRARRRANDLTQGDLAELAGVGRRLISDIEQGKETLRMDGVNAVLAVFGMRLGIVEQDRKGEVR
ncbi:MAG TPA: transcriptional regulator [Polyangiaceae bacterium]|nr:transcriptional regulator [Polyangiaceae bacterium]